MNDRRKKAIDDELLDDEISKSQRKRDAKAIFAFGEQLVALPEPQLKKIPLPDSLRDAINICLKIKKHGGRKRQLLFIAKVMRNIDLDPIYAAYEMATEQSANHKRIFKQLESFRDELVEGNDDILDDIFNMCPDIDRQQLRQLTRNARSEAKKSATPKSARKLFQLLKGSYTMPNDEAENIDENE